MKYIILIMFTLSCIWSDNIFSLKIEKNTIVKKMNEKAEISKKKNKENAGNNIQNKNQVDKKKNNAGKKDDNVKKDNEKDKNSKDDQKKDTKDEKDKDSKDNDKKDSKDDEDDEDDEKDKKSKDDQKKDSKDDEKDKKSKDGDDENSDDEDGDDENGDDENGDNENNDDENGDDENDDDENDDDENENDGDDEDGDDENGDDEDGDDENGDDENNDDENGDDENDDDENGDDENDDDENGDDENDDDENGDDENENDGDDEDNEDDEEDDELAKIFEDKKSPLKITIAKIEGPVKVGQEIFYTVNITNISSEDVHNLKPIFDISFGIDPVEVISASTARIEDEESESISFDYCEILKPGKSLKYEISCDIFNYYREENENFPVVVTILYEKVVEDAKIQVKTIEYGEHFDITGAPYIQVEVESPKELVDTGQKLVYIVEVMNIGPVDAENINVFLTYDAKQFQINKINTSAKILFHSDGRIKFETYPHLKAEDLDSDEQDVLIIKLEGMAITSGYPSGLHISTKLENRQREIIKKSAEKTLKLHKAVYKKKKNNNKNWDIGWKKAIAPDSFVIFSIKENNEWVPIFTSQIMKNNFYPIWEIDTLIKIKLNMQIKITVIDKDLRADDVMGMHTITFNDEIFAKDECEISFGGVTLFFNLRGTP